MEHRFDEFCWTGLTLEHNNNQWQNAWSLYETLDQLQYLKQLGCHNEELLEESKEFIF